MSAKDDLIDWSSRWRISNNVVFCKSCNSQQQENEGSQVFSHAEGCSYEKNKYRPWEELNAISKKLRSS